LLQAWLRQVGAIIKQHAPRQLFLPGVKDLFGHNSPHHLQHNPAAQVSVLGATALNHLAVLLGIGRHMYQPLGAPIAGCSPTTGLKAVTSTQWAEFDCVFKKQRNYSVGNTAITANLNNRKAYDNLQWH
jgi:hypothetical protein